MTAPKIMFYNQHILGMGHLVRSLEILRGLTGFEVYFINGGEMVKGLDMPGHVNVIQLPPMTADADFKLLDTSARQARRQHLLDAFERVRPDALVIELFPFGRKQFGHELIPLLARNRLSASPVPVACSLRDILVEKSDGGAAAQRAVTLMNHYFDQLLIHADPGFQRLEETFPGVAELQTLVTYTGYVTQAGSGELDEPAFINAAADEKRILASIGGGRVGYELLAATVQASALLAPQLHHHLLVFAGPYMSADEYTRLQDVAAGHEHITVRRFTANFLACMRAADLSISMAGYNTCMNILTTGVRALVRPFAGHGNTEQTVRSARLAARGALTVLGAQDLDPQPLAHALQHALREPPPGDHGIDINGVANTATALAAMTEPRQAHARQPARQKLRDLILQTTAPTLEQRRGQPVDIFLRDDDADTDEDTLRELLDIGFARGAPVNLEIVPAKLTDSGISLLKTYKTFDPTLVGLDQHGWSHTNHETTGRKCEFGVSRDYQQQYDDIARGRKVLQDAFGERFFPAFTPPWNRCTADTLKALDALGYKVFSKDRGKERANDHDFLEISISLDIFRWKNGAALKAPGEILEELVAQLQGNEPIGIMLHHKVMDAEAFGFVDTLLQSLAEFEQIRFHSFASLLALRTAQPPIDRN